MAQPHECNAWCVDGGHTIVVLVGTGLTNAEIWQRYRRLYAPMGFVPVVIRPAPEVEYATLLTQEGEWALDDRAVSPPRHITPDLYTPYLIRLLPLEHTLAGAEEVERGNV